MRETSGLASGDRYARSGGLFIAYQVFGQGPSDLVVAPGYMSNVEQNWEWPAYARFLERLSSFSSVILLDRRGTGLSDRASELLMFDDLMDDIRAVMDDAGSEQAAVLGGAEGGPMCILFAATFPERTSALILVTSYARAVDGRTPKRSWTRSVPSGRPCWGWPRAASSSPSSPRPARSGSRR